MYMFGYITLVSNVYAIYISKCLAAQLIMQAELKSHLHLYRSKVLSCCLLGHWGHLAKGAVTCACPLTIHSSQ